MTVLFPGWGIPADPTIAASQVEGRRTETEGPDHVGPGPNQVAQLSSNQGSAVERMQAADESVPEEVLAIVRIGNEAQTQIGDLLDGPGQLGQRRQGLPVVEKLAFGQTGGSGGWGWQTHQALFLQAFDADIGGADTKLAFAITPVGAAAKLLEQFLAWRRLGPQRSGGNSLQDRFTDPASTCVRRLASAQPSRIEKFI